MSDSNYVVMLRESLEKKLEVLKEIQNANERQKDILMNPFSTPEELKETLDRKDELMNVIDALDTGFENVYKRVSKSIRDNRELYKDEIIKMQNLITSITDLSATLQAEEHRNKEFADRKFAKIKERILSVTKNKNAVDSYHKSMGRINTIDPQFMDSKK